MEPWPHPAHPSSSHPQDPHLDKFFTLVHVLEEGAFPFRLKDTVLSEGTVEQELRASLAALRLASPQPLVAFSHHVLDKLVHLVVRPPIIGGQIGEPSDLSFPIWQRAPQSPGPGRPPIAHLPFWPQFSFLKSGSQPPGPRAGPL